MILSLVNQKGGVGKTTTALNLAAVWSAVNTGTASVGEGAQAPVLYVDTDKQASGAVVIEETAAAVAGAEDSARGGALIGRNITTGESIGLPFDFLQVTEPADIRSISEIAKNYKHVLVDTAGSFDDLSRSEAAIDIADFVLVPMLAEQMSRKPTERTIDTMIVPRLGNRFAIAIVNYDSRNGTTDLLAAADWVAEHGYPLINTPIRSWRLVARNTICTVGRRTRPMLEAQADFQALALELTQAA